MATATFSPGAPGSSFGRTLLRAGALTALLDAIFSSCLVIFAYHSTFARLWQGVASTVIGPRAMTGGAATVMLGLVLHVGVAFTWSAVFLAASRMLPPLQRLLRTTGGAVLAAIVFGPCIWLVMSFGVIPAFTHRPPAINFRWWVQFFGHMPAVGLPIAMMVGRDYRGSRR